MTTAQTSKHTYTLIDSRSVERDYGFRGTQAIIENEVGERLFIEDAFGGLDSLHGGRVRWMHGSAYRLLPGDTFAVLDSDSGTDPAYSGIETVYSGMRNQIDPARPWLRWEGRAIAYIAEKLGL